MSTLFLAFLALVAAQRLWELRVSARHAAALLARGAVELGRGHYPFMIAVQVLWLGAMAAEVLGLGARPWPGTPVCAALYVAAEILRQWARRALGGRWTTRVYALPGEPLVTSGPYRRLRHPNYLAVAVEMVAGPLIFGAWRTALGGVALYGLVLAARLRAEGGALRPSA